MSSEDNEDAIQLLERGKVQSVSNDVFLTNHFGSVFAEAYKKLVANALAEWPPIPGYETQHHLLVERMCYFYMMQRVDDAKDSDIDIEWKTYRVNVNAFLKTCEQLLRQAKNITMEKSFQTKLVSAIVEIIDRRVSDKLLKEIIIKDLRQIDIK